MDRKEIVVKISCLFQTFPLGGCIAQLYDLDGNLISSSKSDCSGIAFLKAAGNKYYRVTVIPPKGFAPEKAFRWVHFDPCKKCGLCFCFDKIRCPVRMGRFRLILSDANYPNYKLKEGVFRIWLNTPQQPMRQA